MGNPCIQFGLPLFSPYSRNPMPMIEPYNTILLRNVAGWQDETQYSDLEFTARKANAEIVNNMTWLNYINSCGLIW